MYSSTSFDFQPRTRVVFGGGTLSRAGEIAKSLGGRRALVVSDPGIVAAGYPALAVRVLEEAGLSAAIFRGVEENPTSVHVEEGVAFAKQHGIDLIIGLGGGSSMDCAKGINFLLTNGGRMQDYWGGGKAAKAMLPLIAIPTTAGTGSEAQSFALISDPETHQKMACGDPKAAAAVAILDPAITISQPADVTAVTGIDAIGHALETWVTSKRNPLSRLYSQRAWQLLSESFPRVLEEPSNEHARAGMLLGANFAGTAIENSMLGIAHSCANPLTAHHQVVHGAAVGMLLPAVIRFNIACAGELYEELCPSGGGAEPGEELVRVVDGMLEKSAIPRRLSDYGIAEDELPKRAEEASSQWTARFNPRPVSTADCLKIYQEIY